MDNSIVTTCALKTALISDHVYILTPKFLVKFFVDLRLAVAVDTPTHAQDIILVDFVHLFDWAVAFLTFNASGNHVLLVIEVGIIGEVVNPDPFHWHVIVVGFLNFGNL